MLAVVVPHCGMLGVVKDEAEVREITVLLLPKFKAEATELIGADGIEAVAAHLSEHPGAGDVIPGSGGARKLDGRRRARGSAAARESFTCTSWWPGAFTCFDVMPRPSRR